MNIGISLILISSAFASDLERLLRATAETSLLETMDKTKVTSSGRRRTVNDKDCDGVVGLKDTIEDTCAQHRYQVFTQQYPLIVDTASKDAGVIDSRTAFNNTMEGNKLAFDGEGIRKIFTDQRILLYGPNGTCLEPKAGYLARNADMYTKLLFESNRDVAGVYDTEWANLKFINNVVGVGLTNSTNLFVEKAKALLTAMNDAIAQIAVNGATGNKEYVNKTNALLQPFAHETNALQDTTDGLSEKVATAATSAKAMQTSQMDKVLSKLDAIADMFSTSDSQIGRVVDSLSAQVAPLLAATPPASDQVKQLSNKGNVLIQDYAKSGSTNVNQTMADWTRALRIQLSNSWNEWKTHAGYLAQGQARVSDLFDNATARFATRLNSTQDTLRALVASSQTASIDAKTLVSNAGSRLTTVNGNLAALFESLDGDSSAAVLAVKKQIAALLSSTTSASGAQLAAVIDSITGLGDKTTSMQSDAKTKLNGALANIQSLLALAGAGHANTGAAAADVVSAQASVGQQLVATTGDYQASILGGQMGSTLDLAASQASNMYGAAYDFASQAQGAQGDMQAALAAAGSFLSDKAAAQALSVEQNKNYILSLVGGNGTAIDNASEESGKSLGSVGDNLAWVLTQSAQAAPAQAALSTASRDSTVQVANKVGDLDDSLATGYVGSSRLAAANFGDALDSVSTVIGTKTTGLSSQLQSVVTSLGAGPSDVDRSLDSARDALADMDPSSITPPSTDPGSLASALTRGSSSAFAQAGGLAAAITTGSDSTERDTQQAANAAVNSATAQYASSVDQIAAHSATGTAGAVDPKVAQSINSLSEGTEQVRSQMTLAQLELDALLRTLTPGEAANPDLRGLKKLMNDAMDSISRNLTALKPQASLPDNFAGGIQGVLTSILNSEYAAAGTVAANADKLTSTAADAASGAASAQVIDDMDASASAWGDSFQKNRLAAYSEGQARVDGLAYLSDGARSVATLAGVLGSRPVNTAMTSSDMQAMMSSMYTSVAAANSTLARQASGASANSAFTTQVAGNKADAFMKALDNESLLSSATAGAAGDAMAESTGRQAMDLTRLQATLASDQQKRQARLAAGLAGMSDQDAEFAKNISGNRDAVAINLLMAKRSVRDLLDSWGGYAEYETEKFRKMQSVDQESVQMNSRFIDTARTNAADSLAGSQDALSRTGANVEADVNEYVSFSNSVTSQLGLLSQIVPMLNVSAANSVGQISEAAAGFVAQDSTLDWTARNATRNVIDSFEFELDNRAKMVIASANGQIVPELISR